jgi:hypothetical protein
VFLVQALATSSGFSGPARRGHYDFLFTAGHHRLLIAAGQWTASAAPGVVCWLLVAGLEAAVSRGAPCVALAPATVVGMVFVSTVPWAVTVPLPRLSGGLACVLLLVIALTVVQPVDPTTLAGDPLAVLICPWILVGHEVAGETLIPAVTTLVIAIAALVAALIWINRADFPLETAQ